MPRGDKSKYSTKQKRQARHIEEGYEEKGLSEGESARRAWATVNKMDGGGKKSGAGRGRKTNKEPARKGGRKGGAAKKSSSASSSSRSSSARGASSGKKSKKSSQSRKSSSRGMARKK